MGDTAHSIISFVEIMGPSPNEASAQVVPRRGSLAAVQAKGKAS
jgi:hypothetical protein